MKPLLALFLIIVAALVAEPAITSLPPDLFLHHVTTASIAVAAPSFTLNEWLALRRYSRAQWYRMPPDDKPDVIGKGRMQRITPQADERWLHKQERKAKQSKAA